MWGLFRVPDLSHFLVIVNKATVSSFGASFEFSLKQMKVKFHLRFIRGADVWLIWNVVPTLPCVLCSVAVTCILKINWALSVSISTPVALLEFSSNLPTPTPTPTVSHWLNCALSENSDLFGNLRVKQSPWNSFATMIRLNWLWGFTTSSPGPSHGGPWGRGWKIRYYLWWRWLKNRVY